MRVSTASLFEIPIKDQAKSAANNTLVTIKSVYQTILARPVATARSTWLATAAAKTRAGAKLSRTAVGIDHLEYWATTLPPVVKIKVLALTFFKTDPIEYES